ncbi:MFS general substrate transporter [Linderina pennispora]|uniref:MFS general substrate transporter n=1 Tax=Linderina pennispora TaxID=61395 RepID=A0A1Y1W3F1_9FUNG|nr:MFS general substrate transporter [Linderina pennispora]ORX67684.1 MFS general substrate transporter [Linderina pennispora]
MHGTQYNTLLGLSTAVFLVFQIPLNFLFRKLGARKYMPTTLFLSGCLSVLVLAIKNYGGFLAIRLIEGVFLSGFTCSVFYSLSLWYPQKYLVTRVSWVIASSMHLGNHLCGYGYRIFWMYFFFGLLAIASGIYGYVFTSDYPDTAKYLNDEERELIGRILRTTHMLTSDRSAISRKQVIQAINWAPIILKSVGYSTTVTAGLMLIPAILAFIMIMLANFFVRKLGKIGYFQILMSVHVHSYIAYWRCRCAKQDCTHHITVVVGPAWLNVNQRGADRSALSNGFAIVATSLGGTANGYAYLNSDAPLYIKGNSSNFALTGVAIICTVILMVNFKKENRRRDQNPMDASHMPPDEIAALGNDSPMFRYTL